jgi:hypothetical protein
MEKNKKWIIIISLILLFSLWYIAIIPLLIALIIYYKSNKNLEKVLKFLVITIFGYYQALLKRCFFYSHNFHIKNSIFLKNTYNKV